MKLVALLSLLGTARACLRVHAFLQANPLIHDVMSVQLWDNDKLIFTKRSAEFFSDNEDGFRFDEGEYSVYLTENGKQGWVERRIPGEARPYTQSLKIVNHGSQTYCVTMSDNGCKLNGLQEETCLNDGFGDCGSYTCNNCDYRATCDSV